MASGRNNVPRIYFLLLFRLKIVAVYRHPSCISSGLENCFSNFLRESFPSVPSFWLARTILALFIAIASIYFLLLTVWILMGVAFICLQTSANNLTWLALQIHKLIVTKSVIYYISVNYDKKNSSSNINITKPCKKNVFQKITRHKFV